MKKRILILIALMAALLLVAGPVAAKATKTPYTADYLFYPPTDPGTWTYPDGNVHIRGLVHENIVVATEPRLIGNETLVVNANWDANWRGPMWGTYSIQVAGGLGSWEGTWTGTVHVDDGTVSIRAVGHGREGLEGLKLFLTGESSFLGQPLTITGYILDPHG